MADARRPVKRAYMSIAEVAEYFGINPRTVRRMISSRALSANRIGGQWRIPIKEVEALERADFDQEVGVISWWIGAPDSYLEPELPVCRLTAGK